MTRGKIANSLLLGAAAGVFLSSCKPLAYNTAASEASGGLPATNPWFRDGMAPVIDPKNAKLTDGQTRGLIDAYAHATQLFKEAYGKENLPYWIVSVRSNRFISRGTWDKVKEATNYNPITNTDKYNFDHEKGICRAGNRDENNVWAAFERASSYVNKVMKASMLGTDVPWYSGYASLPHVKNYLQSSGLTGKNSSPIIDINIVLSLHAANGEGATQDSSTCGRLAQFKVCDGHGYSMFFDPAFMPSPCQALNAESAWYPSAADWQAIFSDEMRQLGSTVIPVPTTKVIASTVAPEYGVRCGDPSTALRDKQARDDRANDWPIMKRDFPKSVSNYLDRGHRSAHVAEVAQRSQNGELGAYSIYASVQQVYKDIVNYRLKPGIIGVEAECRPCNFVKDASGYLWDPIRRKALNMGYCPKKCWKQGTIPNPHDATWSGKDLGRVFFEPDSSDANYPSMTNLINRHFADLRKGNHLSVDPIVLATKVQQWYVAMHPFIDGDGRTSRYYMEMILNSVGLPFPVLNDFWQDTTRSTTEYTNTVRQGISRHINTVKACAAYVTCMKSKSSGFTAQQICSAQPNIECQKSLSFSYGGGEAPVAQETNLQPCDCSIHWETDLKRAKYSKCK